MYQLDISRQTITIEGEKFTSADFLENNTLDFASKSDFHADLFLFLKHWFSSDSTISVKTSGSTGTPKEMRVEKSRMMQSAVLTCTFLQLKEDNKALLCMPLQYIAGKMVVVRALVCGLDLYPTIPSGNPLKDTNIRFDFAAMVPLQVYNSLNVDSERQKLQTVKNLIIGGGAIDPQIEEAVKLFPNKVFSTYGMTETLSHIALRKLNGTDVSSNYFPFDSVALSLSEDNTLIIDAPQVSSECLFTNDIAEINPDGSFRIIGRKDNFINSGGVKIQIEEVEKLIRPFVDISFAISSLPDPKFGEIIVLVTEEEVDLTILEKLEPTYFIPKHFIKVDKIPLTETSKIDRPRLKALLVQQNLNQQSN